MRFERLDLAPYGRFADFRLAFSPSAALHVVLGRNEAGKTTTLEAISDLLFGFPGQTKWGFEYDQRLLRVGTVLRMQDGAALEVRRRKGTKNTLVDDADKPVDEERLRAALTGVDRATFEAEFGLSQKNLRAGGDALLKAGGKLAETLAAGSAGLSALVRLRDRLDEEAARLFTPRRSEHKEFYVALDRHDKADRVLRDAIVTADALHGAERKRAEALDAEQRLREERDATARGLALRERADRTRATLDRLAASRRRLAEFADLPEIDASGLAATRQALDEDRALRAGIARLAAETEAEAREIAVRVPDRTLLDTGAAIEACREKLSEVRKAAEDLPRRVEAHKQAVDQLDDLARRLGLGDSEALLADQPADAEIAAARHALEARREAVRRRDEARERRREAARRREELAAETACAPDPEPLRRRLDALAERVADAARLKPECAALDREAQDLADASSRLDPPVADPDALARTPLPAAAVLASFAEAGRTRAQARDLAARELDKAARARAAAETILNACEREAAGATRADWLAARASRERGLDALGAALDGDAAARRDAYAQARALTLAADAIGDRAAEDIERAARLEAARGDLAARSRELAEANARTEGLRAERETAETEWRALWVRSGVAPLPPAAMLRWREQIDTLLTRRAALAARRDAFELLRARVAEAETDLVALGLTAPSSFETAYREARAELAARQTAYEAARKRAQEQAQAVRLSREAETEAERREGELADLAANWTAAMRAMRLPAEASPEAAEAAFAAWGAVPAPRAMKEREMRSIEGIERDLAEFAREVRLLVDRIAPDLAPEKPETAVAQLVERLAEARRVAVERGQLEKSAESRAARGRAEESKRHALAPALAAACARFGAADDDALGVALERCEDRRDLVAEAAEAQRLLAQAGDRLGEAELRAEQRSLDLACVGDEIASLKRRAEEIEAALREAARAVRDAEVEYETLARGRDAAGAMRERVEARGELLDVAERWLLRAAAAKLAGRAIERHRASAQDPLIARAGELFALATAGHFTGLGVDFDERSDPVLAARRVSGAPVSVAALSEGARDQLFLSLRLALLERRFGEPLPFIGDDLLASFDDERALHTLDLLAEFGARRQTILFTHHARIAELARGLNSRAVEVIEI